MSKKTNITALVLSIFSIITCTIWYLSIGLGVTSLILSIKAIKEDGKLLPKITTVFSIIGLCACYIVYINIISLILVEFI